MLVAGRPVRVATASLVTANEAKPAMAPGTQAVLEGYAHSRTARLLRAERIIVAGRTTELR